MSLWYVFFVIETLLNLEASKKVYGFGFNSYVQLSQDQQRDYGLPVLITTNSLIVDIWCGWHHSIFETSEGGYLTCGSNGSGELAGTGVVGGNVLKIAQMSVPTGFSTSSFTWRIITCSFSSVSFYQAVVSNTKRVEWMVTNLKRMVSERSEFSDLVIEQ